jgi:hypothetical protein
MSTDHEASHYAGVSSTLLPHPSYAEIFSSAPDSQTLLVHVPPSMLENKFPTHTKNR